MSLFSVWQVGKVMHSIMFSHSSCRHAKLLGRVIMLFVNDAGEEAIIRM